jgi:prepilin-type N-terminal cleavage/methylation domain-containing protein
MKQMVNKHMSKFKPSRNPLPCPFGKSDKAVFNKGFTLVEVIVTIIATAILGVIFINFMGTAMSKSTRAVELVRDEARAEALLECIVADYVFKMNQDSSNALTGLISDITNKRICGLNNPATPSITTAYIAFDAISGNEIAPGGLNRTLKVTVTASGNDLTTLLTSSRDADSPPVAF